MKPDEMDRIIEQAAGRIPESGEDSRVVEDIGAMLLNDLRPVRPIGPVWLFTVSFIALFAILAGLSGVVLGPHGLHALSSWQMVWLFNALLGTTWIAAVASARAMRPASGIQPGLFVPVFAISVFLMLFWLVFSGYGLEHFLSEGMPCLVAGMAVSVPTAVAIAWLLRRGFVLDWRKAGAAAGTLAGLTGLGMLEIHCANLKAIHVMVWHGAVVMLSAVLGFAAGWIADRLGHKMKR